MAKAIVMPVGVTVFDEYGKTGNWDTEPLFSELFNQQFWLMKRLGFPRNDLTYDEIVEEVVHCVGSEAAEMAAPFLVKTKPWKKEEYIDSEHLFEESIDVLHFLLELWILLGVTPQQVADEYKTKNAKNRERISEKLAKSMREKMKEFHD